VIPFDGSESSFSFRRISDIRAVFWVVRKDPRVYGSRSWNQRFVLGDREQGARYDSDIHVGTQHLRPREVAAGLQAHAESNQNCQEFHLWLFIPDLRSTCHPGPRSIR
jgi:hypothetical protein